MNGFEKEAREDRRRGRASNPLIKAGRHSLSFDGLKTWEVGRNGSRKSPGFPRTGSRRERLRMNTRTGQVRKPSKPGATGRRPYAMEGCPHRGRPMAPSEGRRTSGRQQRPSSGGTPIPWEAQVGWPGLAVSHRLREEQFSATVTAALAGRPPCGACGRGWHRAAGWATSAHTRGWTPTPSITYRCPLGFPAHAGIRSCDSSTPKAPSAGTGTTTSRRSTG